MNKRWLKITTGVIGLFFVIGMLFANQLGLDSNPVWGIRRYIIFSAGIILIAISFLYREENFIGKLFHTDTGQIYTAVGVLSSVIMLIYIWYASIGLWTRLPNETNYFDLQANAFRHGQIALEVKPDPALLTLDEPYEPSNREGIPVLWDATLYNGKYYLYWGPAPALLLTLVKLVYMPEVGDKIITLIFTIALFIFTTLLILELWKTYFSKTPRWTVLLGIAFTALANPILFMLIEARIYEGAIIAGQCFLIGGLYWLCVGFNKSSLLSLSLAGIFFVFAIGSRTTLVPSVALISVIVLIWAVKTGQTKVWSLLLAFGVPLLLGAILYAWYNVVRFGSITEFGFRYQLTSYNLYESMDETYSPVYFLPNTYKSLFNSLEWRTTVPHLFPTRWDGPTWLEKDHPKFYLLLAESITGIFIATPFLVFAFLTNWKNKNINWILFSLAGATLGAFITMQGFFFTAMRYLLDFTPTLALLAVIGFWQSLEAHKLRWLIITIGIILFIYSIGMSFLLPISGRLDAYRAFNPDLLFTLNQLFSFFTR
jgi:hypothetical protein